MPGPGERPLSLAESLVLGLACEGPTHGFALARLLSRPGSVGQVMRGPKYTGSRARRRLEQLGLVQMAGAQHTSLGPERLLIEATGAGRSATRIWLRTTVAHGRDVRLELMLKLALLHRAGTNPTGLLQRQRAE